MRITEHQKKAILAVLECGSHQSPVIHESPEAARRTAESALQCSLENNVEGLHRTSLDELESLGMLAMTCKTAGTSPPMFSWMLTDVALVELTREASVWGESHLNALGGAESERGREILRALSPCEIVRIAADEPGFRDHIAGAIRKRATEDKTKEQ